MSGVEKKIKEKEVIIPKKPSDFNLDGVVIDISQSFRWHGHDLPVNNPGYVDLEKRKGYLDSQRKEVVIPPPRSKPYERQKDIEITSKGKKYY